MESRFAGRRRVLDLHALTGARFIAAAGVLTGHFAMQHDLLGAWAWANARNAVAFFFVLSGFVLTYNYADRLPRGDAKEYFKFVQARFARVYPVYLLVLLSGTALALWLCHRDPSLWPTQSPARLAFGWMANLFMVQSYGWDQTVIGYWSGPAWSLSCEATFYLLFPLILWRIRRLERPSTIVWCMAASWLSTVLAVAAMTLLVTVGLHKGRFVAEIIEYNAPYLRVGDFVTGCLAGLWFVRRGSQPWPSRLGREIGLWAGLAAFVTVGMLTNYHVIPESCGISLPFVPPAVVVVLALASGPTSLGRFLSTRPMTTLGEASYSLYLIHWLPMMLITRMTTEPQLLWSCLAMVACVAASLLLFRYVEDPCRKLLRRPVRGPMLGLELAAAQPQLAVAAIGA